MQLKILEDAFSICKIKDLSGVDLQADFLFFARTDEELSLVCQTAKTPVNCTDLDSGWRAFRIKGQLDFSLIGILSKISTIIAEQAIGIFVVSTFNTDYILVKDVNLTRAIDALSQSGYQFV